MPYRYAGQHPVPDGQGGIVRPGDVRDEPDPGFGPWDEIPGPETPQEPAAAPAAPVPAPAPPAAPRAATPPATSQES